MLRKPVLGWATIATSAVPPAELAMVSTPTLRAYFFLRAELLRLFLWSVAAVIMKTPLAKPAFGGESESTCDTSVSGSTATKPLILALVSHSTNWNPGGLQGIPPEAKLPNSYSQVLLMYRQRSGYLTATTEWYVIGLTLELDASPHAWISLTPAVWEFSTA